MICVLNKNHKPAFAALAKIPPPPPPRPPRYPPLENPPLLVLVTLGPNTRLSISYDKSGLLHTFCKVR